MACEYRTGNFLLFYFFFLTIGFPVVTTAQIAVSPPCGNTSFSGEPGESGPFGEAKMNCKCNKRGTSGICTPAARGASACQLSLLVNFALCSIITCNIGVGFYTVIR